MKKEDKIREIEKEIINLYNKGLSAKKVGEQIGRSKNGVLYILHKYNIDTSNRQYDLRSYSIDSNYLHNIDTPEKAYIIGMMMTDGNVLDDNTIQLTLQEQDKYILEHIRILFKLTYPLIKIKKGKYYSLRFNDRQIAEDLKSYNIVPRKSLILKPPIIKDELYKYVVLGYFDGDGSIWLDKSVNQYSIQFVGTYDVLNDFKNKMNWKDNKIRQAKKDNKYTYRLGYHGNILVSNILSELYDNKCELFLTRKYNKYLQCLKLKEDKEKTKKQIWINNLGSYIGNNVQKNQ